MHFYAFMHETDGYQCHGGCPGQRVKIPEILTQNPGNALKNYGMYAFSISFQMNFIFGLVQLYTQRQKKRKEDFFS